MVVGILRLDVVLYSPGSLKEKRGIVRRILDRCRVRFPVSCAETGLQDQWQRAELGFAMVGYDRDIVLKVFEQIEDELASFGDAEVGERHTEILQY
ncbi:MAG: DUF503 domain-containing protein [Desulfuromonadales bacterium]|nr:DUF503 domain-containing protein [Desulfuromonadales bacterium]